MKRIFLFAIAISFFACNPGASNGSLGKGDTSPEKEKFSYAVGINFGEFYRTNIKAQPMMDSVVDAEIALKAMKTYIQDSVNIEMSLDSARAFSQKFVTDLTDKIAEKNAKDGLGYLEKSLADGMEKTESGLLYKVVKAGEGAKPALTDKVRVKYTGKLIDGKVFDSTEDGRGTQDFGVNQVIKGWQEGLQLMAKGGKYEFVIPAELAYGKQGPPQIGPNQTLVFDVELVDINPKEPAKKPTTTK